MIEKILKDISDKYSCTYVRDCDMKPYTTFKIGGRADYAAFVSEPSALVELCMALDKEGVRYLVVGNGSNLLFPDEGYAGVVILTVHMKNIEVRGNNIFAQSGASLIKVSCAACEASLSGLEFAYGIPASVGGAIYMNAGAYGSEISYIVKSVRCYDREKKEVVVFDNKGCNFSYRNSIFESSENRYIILDCEFELEKGEKMNIRALMDDYMSRRREKQPLEYPSAGSAFKRAPGYFTAKLIDEAGLKGYSIGGAKVSEKHAGFIINTGLASASDVKNLMEHIKSTVKEKFDVDIESEIRIIG